ncbi:MAG: hypothetical protein IPP93_12820, partial [Chitinophagaceae bacterium]|nr:hypothetical protein [Chitinophagaceae bacterium]
MRKLMASLPAGQTIRSQANHPAAFENSTSRTHCTGTSTRQTEQIAYIPDAGPAPASFY